MLAILWGITGTWWMGALLGFALAFVSTRGAAPVREVPSLLSPIISLLLAMAFVAAGAGFIGHSLVDLKVISLGEPFASRLPSERHAGFVADACANTAGYIVGIIGGCLIIWRVWRSRQGL